MTKELDGKAVLITGASSGIGRIIAIELAKAGADLWLVGRSASELEATAAMVKEAGGPPARVAAMDIAQRGPLAALIADIGASHPHLFAVVNNAGVMHPEPILAGTVERWEAMFDINVLAMLEGCKAAVEVMRGHKQPGHLINIGSVAARFDVPGVYGITKRAVEAIGETLREELEPDDIRVCTIVPGGFTSQLARGLREEEMTRIAASFARQGLDLSSGGNERVMSDPQHIAEMVRYVLSRPIDLNIQEIVIRPAVSVKY